MINTRQANSKDSRELLRIAELSVRKRVSSRMKCPNCEARYTLLRYYEDNSLYCFECSYGYNIGKSVENRFINETQRTEVSWIEKKQSNQVRLVKKN